ncbi:MAG: hypothetical protein Q4D72_03305 [Capnocytophaga sp.]|nr:hypothetical protein [Capnocytophaga sp.]MDO5104903.1 hypothetical protein [Capnocytophaga sp.]
MVRLASCQIADFCGWKSRDFFDRTPQRARSFLPPEITLLENQELDFEGIRFCSVVARPYLKNEVQTSENVDFLITHTPIKCVLDEGIGCPYLRSLVIRCNPKFHIFGHIHSQGLQRFEGKYTTFCNVSYFNHLRDAYIHELTQNAQDFFKK